jgi:hypothetical protein
LEAQESKKTAGATMKRLPFYLLAGKTPLPVSQDEWAKAAEVNIGTPNWRVALDVIGEATISTVFLGLDHGLLQSRPLLFETMVFEGELDSMMDRYGTWNEALEGHAAIVAAVRRTLLKVAE